MSETKEPRRRRSTRTARIPHKYRKTVIFTAKYPDGVYIDVEGNPRPYITEVQLREEIGEPLEEDSN